MLKKTFNNEENSFQVIEMAKNRMPQIYENPYKEWVLFGEDNLYPNYILSMFNRSSKNAAILGTMSDMIVGQGFKETRRNKDFIKNKFNKENLQDILKKISFDLVVYGAYALNIIWDKKGTSIAQIKYIDVNKVRFAKPEDGIENEDDEWYFLCPDWNKTRKYPPTKIQGFNPNNIIEKSQLLYVKRYRPGLQFYALPHYISSINWIELDYEVSNFHLQSTLNGYMPSLIINMAQGVPSPDKQKEIKKQLDANFKGTDNAGSTILTFSEGKDKAVEVNKIDLNAADTRFITLEEQIMQNILIANKATSPMLFGVRVQGQLGGRTELLDSFELYQIQVISKFQELIINTFNNLMTINGINEKIEIERYKIFEQINAQINPDNNSTDTTNNIKDVITKPTGNHSLDQPLSPQLTKKLNNN